MRLLHTADLHLDACFASSGIPTQVANRRRQSLRDVLHAMVRRAAEWPADALLIAGDLFDLDRVSRDTVAFLQAEFESIRPVPVVVAPGNHDPFMAGSPYATESWPDNVVIFSKPVWTAHALKDGQLVVHGFAFDGFDISVNPFGALEVPADGAVHIAIGHGTERAHQPPDGESYAPFDAVAAAVPGLRYVALGHFHRLTPIPAPSGIVMYYPGAPEGHGFDETGPHYHLEVEIEADDVRATPVPSATVHYATHEVDCSDFTTSHQVVEAIRLRRRSVDAPQVARVTLTGVSPQSIIGEIPAIYDAVAHEFEHLSLIDETTPLEDYEAVARETTTLGEFLRRLNEEIRDAPDPARRRLLERTREVGLAAYRDRKIGIVGLDVAGDGP
jgi:DNA repair exonuclease SbcCD nuclease subunit